MRYLVQFGVGVASTVAGVVLVAYYYEWLDARRGRAAQASGEALFPLA